MGWGLTGIVNALTQKALIRYVPVTEGKTIEQLEEEQGITGFGNFAIMGVLIVHFFYDPLLRYRPDLFRDAVGLVTEEAAGFRVIFGADCAAGVPFSLHGVPFRQCRPIRLTISGFLLR